MTTRAMFIPVLGSLAERASAFHGQLREYAGLVYGTIEATAACLFDALPDIERVALVYDDDDHSWLPALQHETGWVAYFSGHTYERYDAKTGTWEYLTDNQVRSFPSLAPLAFLSNLTIQLPETLDETLLDTHAARFPYFNVNAQTLLFERSRLAIIDARPGFDLLFPTILSPDSWCDTHWDRAMLALKQACIQRNVAIFIDEIQVIMAILMLS